jgi:hypothetical protein
VSWSGADVGPSGIASYDVARSSDGKPFKVIASAIAGSSIGWGVALGHTYRFEVRARDKAGNVGAWVAGPRLHALLVQQNSSLVKLAGATTRRTGHSFSGGSARSLDRAGASATLRTKARSLSFLTMRGPGRGEVNVYVDGVFQARINLGASAATYRYVAFSKTWATVGTHTIKVVAVGTSGRPRVDVDGFGVIR